MASCMWARSDKRGHIAHSGLVSYRVTGDVMITETCLACLS